MFQRFVNLLQRLWARLSWTGGVHYLNGGPGLPPPLTPEEEKALLARMADGDPAARDELITHNLRLVVYLAKKYEGSGVPSEDMVSIGTIGLIKGISTFKPEKGARLATYAARCVENAILSQRNNRRLRWRNGCLLRQNGACWREWESAAIFCFPMYQVQ